MPDPKLLPTDDVRINYLLGQILALQMTIGMLAKILKLEGFDRIPRNLSAGIESVDFHHAIRQNFSQPPGDKKGESEVGSDSPESIPEGFNPGVLDCLRTLSQIINNQ